MASDTLSQAEVEDRFWKTLTETRTAMLGLVGQEAQHFQPMTAFVERDTNTVWFYTYKDSDLAEAIASGAPAMLTLQTDKLQACLGGTLSLDHDVERINRYWGPVVAAWYPDGKDDPRLTMMRLSADDAQVWVTEAGSVRFAWEIAKANATHDTPDVGQRTNLNFH